MSYLVDTSVLFYYVTAPERISPKAAELLAGPAPLQISVASALEIAIKVTIGKARTHRPVDEFIDELTEMLSATILPISVEHAAALPRLPVVHRDPFDRILAAQAIAEGLVIVSPDAAFDALGAPRAW
ncbi:type II toxin-antitoxin system VapC family toxin [Tepidiforma flava]|uniref:Type II toxin-antitoxin system VapC family toxin n=1 Tax=Tepidiforma flava TaxID=3004094 RepID=A0ABY7MA98_9CHLR|nr:type II toxin-antitoxin system VapC family toxin [Tepidiforma flava]WBL36943.1 type II toxin-antitoxin system VapC family toxin [Tepidiforma flava]